MILLLVLLFNFMPTGSVFRVSSTAVRHYPIYYKPQVGYMLSGKTLAFPSFEYLGSIDMIPPTHMQIKSVSTHTHCRTIKPHYLLNAPRPQIAQAQCFTSPHLELTIFAVEYYRSTPLSRNGKALLLPCEVPQVGFLWAFVLETPTHSHHTHIR